MKTLADEIAGCLTAQAVTLVKIASLLGADLPSVRRAAQGLNDSGRALLVRRRRALHLASTSYPAPVCKNCYVEFARPKKSKRQCCTRACGIAWSWTRPGVREKRKAGIKVERATPAAKARLAAHNARRWSKPGERERMSEQNRRQWADPVKKSKRAAGIRSVQGSKEMRALYSEIRKAYWDDPDGRARMVSGIRKSKQSPESRAKFSALLRARWADPEGRKIYLAGVRKTAAKMSERNRGKKQSAEHIRKRTESMKRTKRKQSAGLPQDNCGVEIKV